MNFGDFGIYNDLKRENSPMYFYIDPRSVLCPQPYISPFKTDSEYSFDTRSSLKNAACSRNDKTVSREKMRRVKANQAYDDLARLLNMKNSSRAVVLETALETIRELKKRKQ